MFLGLALALTVLGIAYAMNSSAYISRRSLVRTQPVPFSHKHHVGGLGLDCRYCHSSVEESAVAGIPAVHTCMTCHSQIWTQSEMLEPVRRAYRENEPLAWTRVHDLPDFVYFDHSVHLYKGIGCASCHGRVDEMPLVWQEHTLHMGWCLDCHRAPEKFVRPRQQVFSMTWQSSDQTTLGEQLVREYDVKSREDCYGCHR